jgi:hypothetical protein
MEYRMFWGKFIDEFGPGYRSRYSDLLRDGRSGDRLPGEGGLRTHPDSSWAPPSRLYNVYRVYPMGRAAGA